MRLIANIIFYTTYFALCCTQHKDDIISSCENFTQMKRKLMQLGAKSVTGLFLGKTVKSENQK